MESKTKLGRNGANGVAKALTAGTIGGLVGAWVMSEFQSVWSNVSEKLQQPRGNQGRGSNQDSGNEDQDPATIKAARRISEDVFHHKLDESEGKPAGQAVHYAMGAVSGAIYGVMSEIAPPVALGAGVPFGAAVWLIADDVAVPALGLSKWPTEYPLSTNAYALTSHVVYGLTTDLVRRFVRRALR